MGIDLTSWRARIGTFAPTRSNRRSKGQSGSIIDMINISLSIRLCLFFLLLAQGIESNPGPPKQTRSKSSARRGDASAEPDVDPPSQDHPTSLHSWLRPSTQQTTCAQNTTTMDALNSEDIDIDSNTLLLEIYKNV